MLLFKKILNFSKEGGLSDKRGATRYPVGAKYPLKAKVTLVGRDGEGHILKADDNRAMDWGGQLVNMSSGGVSMRLHPAAMGDRGENCRLKLELDNKLFEIDATIAHFWSGPQYATCGVALKFPDAHTQKAFRQLVEPVAIGGILQPLDEKAVEQDAPGLKKEQYVGDEETLLTVWRTEDGKVIEHFELLTHDYFIRGSAQAPGLQIGFQDGVKVGSKVSRPAMPVAMPATQQNEVRRLFLLIVPNIPKAVPSDVRAFL
ncbi:MAG: PilZ domain-containing protein, partial [Opitutus sp.]